MSTDDQRRNLINAGLLLFLLALLFGVAMELPWLGNQRMGLTAHLFGLMGGLFLLALGSVWREQSLSPRLAAAAFLLVIYSNYANFFTAILAAAFGTDTPLVTPLAGSKHPAAPWKEAAVYLGLASGVPTGLAGTALVLWGTWKGGRRPVS